MMYSRGLDDSGWTYRRRRITGMEHKLQQELTLLLYHLYNYINHYNNYCKLLYQYSSMLSAPDDSLLLLVNTSLIWKRRCRGPAPLYGSNQLPDGKLHRWCRQHAYPLGTTASNAIGPLVEHSAAPLRLPVRWLHLLVLIPPIRLQAATGGAFYHTAIRGRFGRPDTPC